MRHLPCGVSSETQQRRPARHAFKRIDIDTGNARYAHVEGAPSKWGANVPLSFLMRYLEKHSVLPSRPNLVILRISDDSLGKAGAHARDGIDDIRRGNDDDDDRSLGLACRLLLRMPSPSRPHRKLRHY